MAHDAGGSRTADQAPSLDQRRDYGRDDLRRTDLRNDPIAQLEAWIEHASTTDQLVEPTAMTLATVDADGRPAARTVLLRRITNGRLLFFTNYGSRKGDHIEGALAEAGEAHGSVLFRWARPARQVEVRGTVRRATAEESDEYFATRPRESQIGAHASPQSRPIDDRDELEARLVAVAARFDGVEDIPRPDDWGGYALTPHTVEFWQGRSSRLHDRFRYERDGQDEDGWRITRLAP
ncbi:pyridoxamine 5'-phosphate oxidase [Euzebya tangerina]|uniref:pyridoxamine 5'-phosphate oxidase n=1 Tax=Euzebya tangerina TaxID=591198 RepID=UPI000E30E7FF|nr:pyridoxamine 5'-phosphate oxidase [Euzebya tangerina]